MCSATLHSENVILTDTRPIIHQLSAVSNISEQDKAEMTLFATNAISKDLSRSSLIVQLKEQYEARFKDGTCTWTKLVSVSFIIIQYK